MKTRRSCIVGNPEISTDLRWDFSKISDYKSINVKASQRTCHFFHVLNFFNIPPKWQQTPPFDRTSTWHHGNDSSLKSQKPLLCHELFHWYTEWLWVSQLLWVTLAFPQSSTGQICNPWPSGSYSIFHVGTPLLMGKSTKYQPDHRYQIPKFVFSCNPSTVLRCLELQSMWKDTACPAKCALLSPQLIEAETVFYLWPLKTPWLMGCCLWLRLMCEPGFFLACERWTSEATSDVNSLTEQPLF